ncbi:MAG: Rpn family recombination-promoting nuclease/putative transposase [Candidatus Amoebophilus sp.]
MAHKIKTPHDAYFQTLMEIVGVARSFFMAHLVPTIADELDWETLQIADSVRRESNRRSSYTDITYKCCIKGQNTSIYLNVEQERKVDPFILERILQYNHRLYTKCRKQGHKKLPIIINFVLYNGNKQKNYPHHEYMHDYFDVPWIAKLLMGKSFFLINLNKEDDALLSKHGESSVMELLLKRASDRNFITWIRENHKLLQDVPVKGTLEASLDYILQVGQGKAEEIIEAFTSLFPQFKEHIMTAARQLEKRGEKRGMELGIQTTAQAIAKNMLKDGEAIEKIIRYTGLSREAIEKLKQG